MIHVDYRTGSDRLGHRLRQRRLPVEFVTLPYGDVSIVGQGPEGRPVLVGLEHKQISDALACITDGRFAGHQLPGLLTSYEVVVLVIEGEARASLTDGVFQVRHAVKGYWYDAKVGPRKFMYRDFDHWLMTMAFKCGVRVVRTRDMDESAQYVADLYSWWTAKEWADHRSNSAMHNPLADEIQMVRPSLVRQIAACLPGVGLTKSAEVARTFKSVVEMIMADESEWREIAGIGKGIAKSIVDAVQGVAVDKKGKKL